MRSYWRTSALHRPHTSRCAATRDLFVLFERVHREGTKKQCRLVMLHQARSTSSGRNLQTDLVRDDAASG